MRTFSDRLVRIDSFRTQVLRLIGTLRPGLHPMDVLRTGLSLLGMSDPDAQDGSPEGTLRQSIRLLGPSPCLSPTATGSWDCRLSHGDHSGGFAEHLLRPHHRADTRGDTLATPWLQTLNVSLILCRTRVQCLHLFRQSRHPPSQICTDPDGGSNTLKVRSTEAPMKRGGCHAARNRHSGAGGILGASGPRRESSGVMGFGHRVLKQGDAAR